MANEANESFDLDKLQQLVEMMEKHDLREVKLSKGGQKWILRRGPQEVVQVPAAMNMMPPAAMPAAPAQAPARPRCRSRGSSRSRCRDNRDRQPDGRNVLQLPAAGRSPLRQGR